MYSIHPRVEETLRDINIKMPEVIDLDLCEKKQRKALITVYRNITVCRMSLLAPLVTQNMVLKMCDNLIRNEPFIQKLHNFSDQDGHTDDCCIVLERIAALC